MLSRTGDTREREHVHHVEVQRLSWRLWAVDLLPTVALLAVSLALWADPRAATVGLGYLLVRRLAYTGRHRRRLVVTDRAIRHRPAVIPLADVVSVATATRSDMARIEGSGDAHTVLLGPGAMDGVVLQRRTPEGIEHEVLVGTNDPEGLRSLIERLRHDAPRPELAEVPRPLPLRARQGADALLAGLPFAVTLALDAGALTTGGFPVFTALWAFFVLWPATRRVTVDEHEVRVGRRGFSPSELESIRLVSRAESLGIPAVSLRRPLWGPPYALVLVVAEGAGPDRWTGPPVRRSVHLGIPRPVDLTGVVEQLAPRH